MRKSTLWLFLAAAIVSSAQTFTTLATFDKTNGLHPFDGLVQGVDGNFYGTTEGGRSDRTFYAGTVFRVTGSGTLTTLHSMGGEYPYAGLLQAADGNFYGTTIRYNHNYNHGLIFKITPEGTFSKFQLSPGGGTTAPLTQAVDGDFYGVTGTAIFKLTPGGVLTTLYTFCASNPCPDGRMPWAGLVEASDGNFYGTASEGGSSKYLDAGAIFKITPAGHLKTVYNFCVATHCPDGASPFAGLIQATDGNFYGTTVGGGVNGKGTIFQITPTGKFTTLYSFRGRGDGMQPYGTLIQVTDGNFYGATYGDGDVNSSKKYFGTVYRLSTGLAPFVTTLTPSGSVGASVTILGTNLTGATAVTFNGTPAGAFTVNASGSAISTTVPSGATTGTIQVTLPGGGTLSSNLPFQVTP